MNQKKRVLLLCVSNSCRSQMAEGLVRYYLGDYYNVESAGNIPTKVNSYAIKVMMEIGIDISHYRPKSTSEFHGQEFDIVITVCNDNDSFCPIWHGIGKKVSIGFPDPARIRGTEDEILKEFRFVRDDMKEKLIKYLKDSLTDFKNPKP